MIQLLFSDLKWVNSSKGVIVEQNVSLPLRNNNPW